MKNYNILKGFCEKIFLVGSGNFWYEKGVIGDDSGLYYRLFTFLLFLSYCSMTLLEIAAALFGDFSDDEKRDSITFSVSHTIVMIKIFSIIFKKERIKKLMSDMVEVCERYEKDVLMAEKYTTIKMNVIAYIVIVYGSASCFVFEGLRKVYAGSHFVTVVTYYPSFTDDSTIATVVRILTTVILFLMMLSMIVTVDGFTMTNLIMFKYKFITLRHYFEELRGDVERMSLAGDREHAAVKLRNGLIEGVIMHKELIRLGKEIDKVFGTVMACQLCQSSGSAVSLLLQIAVTYRNTFGSSWYYKTFTTGSEASFYREEPARNSALFKIRRYNNILSKDLTFVASLKIIFFVAALFFLLGLYLCNAGEITYQASLLCDSIFYCGWHVFPPNLPRGGHLRKLVSIACLQAQRPLIMKAFKMLELTYNTFLLVVRGTYSVFALFYAHQEKK